MMLGCISILSNLCRTSIILFERESALDNVLSRGTSCGSVGFWSNGPLLLSIRFLNSREAPEFWTPLGSMSPLLAFVWPLLQVCLSRLSSFVRSRVMLSELKPSDAFFNLYRLAMSYLLSIIIGKVTSSGLFWLSSFLPSLFNFTGSMSCISSSFSVIWLNKELS